ncbi:MAG: peptide ABC transporter substrate-binding protein [Anaerolineales bacterium]|nr:peptide ABC transporter substrate-binding protein [Anaerolineales bacterium]
MKTTRNWISLSAAAAILSLAFGWRADSGARRYPREETLYLSGGESADPRDYDPATTRSSGDKRIFSGLFSFSPQLDLMPDLVESYTVREGRVFTFFLRANAQFHDGRAVTAQDVVYSWERAADPATDSDTVLTYLGDIVGVRERKAGQADHISGLRAVDARTLEVTIDQPKPYFLAKLTYPTAFVVDRANVESGPDWYRRPNGTGPYKLASWESMAEMVYERNENFYLGAPAIRYIVIRLYSGVPIRLYESNEIDIGSVYWYDVPRVSDPENPLYAELTGGADLCTQFVVFDNTRKPFDDPKVRQAFSLAFDRQQFVNLVFDGVALPATGLYPPGMPGRREGLESLRFDPSAAKALLSESRYAGDFPVVLVTDAGYGSALSSDLAAMASMWKQYLGVTVRVENLQPEKFWDEIEAGRRGQMWSSGWCADYPDPENFADILFHTQGNVNEGGYSNPELDAILEAGRIEPDVQKRILLYQQAEDIILKDMPVLFTVHYLSYVLVKPYVRGFIHTPIDIPIERYLSIDASKL